MIKRKIALLMAVIILLSITTSALSLPVGTEMCAAAENNESSLQTAVMSAQGKVSSMKIALGKDQGVADVDVKSSDSEGTILDIDVQSIQEEEITVNNEVFQILSISGYDYTYEVGKPQMPVIRETIGIPDGASVQATILDASYSTYKGYNVYPVQPPEVDLRNNSEFVIDEEFYSQDVFYPKEVVEVGVPGIWRDLSVVGLQVNPVMFNPATGELRVYDRIKIKLEYYDGVTEKKTIEPKFDRMYSSVILNYDYLDIVVEEDTIPRRDNVGLEDEPGDQVTVCKDEGAVDVGVLSSDSRGTIISISNVEVEEEEITVNGEMFQILTIPGYDYTYEVGKPQMPVIRETIGIPDGASVRATILDASYSTYKGYNVYPVQPPEVDRVEGTEFVIDEEFYSQDVFYPEELVEVGVPGIWRDLNVVSVQVNPVMFNPATGELRIYDRIKLELEYYDGVTETKTIEPQFARMYEDVILNLDYLDIVIAGGEGTFPIQEDVRLDTPADDIVKYISLRHEDHCNFAITPLLDYHASQGLPCEDWYYPSGSSPTDHDIKNFFVGQYAEHPELEYVLLVGDISFLPWNASWDGVPGDYWYACLTDDDLWPEVAVGRISANNDGEVTQQVNKILTYLQSPPSGSWVNKVLLVAHKQDAPGVYQGCKQDIRTAVYTDGFTFDTAYGASAASGGDDATNADVTSAINAGRGIVNYRGHGAFGDPAPRPWGTFWGAQYANLDPAPWNTAGELYTTTEAHALANGDKTPVVFSISCMNNALDNPIFDCLGEAFVKDDDSAVAFLGATRPSYTYPNHYFDRFLFDCIGNSLIYDIGLVLNCANGKLIDKYGEGNPYMKNNLQTYLWLGDPALELWTTVKDDTIGVRRGRQWILSNSNAAPSVAYRVNYGSSTDIPITGDWNGNGVDTIGVRRGRQWILSNSNAVPVVAYRVNYGMSTDIPVVGDWNGNGVDTIGVRRGRQWILSNSNTAPYVAYRFNFGMSTDIPVVGDWNGNGVDTIGVRRGRQWILSNSNTAPSVAYRFNYGLSTDIPVVGDWNGDGVDTIGVRRGRQWILSNSNTAPSVAYRFNYGLSTDIPVVGNWI